ncbi:MAG TPA: DUF454 family protein [Gammaproteobacteria bacterium]
MSKGDTTGGLLTNALALVLVAACVVIGLAGLVLPVIPGLLFLAVAALLAAGRFPRIAARLRSHRSIGRHLGRHEAFARLGALGKLEVVALMAVKIVLDGLASIASYLGRSRQRRNPRRSGRRSGAYGSSGSANT